MSTVAIRTSSRLPAAKVAEVQQLLIQVYRQANKWGIEAQLEYDPAAPTLEAYQQVGRVVVRPNMDRGTCYALYLTSVAMGVPEDIAYAACLVSLGMDS